MFRLYCLILGYAAGCIQCAYIISSIHHIDLRKQGSGNLGSTNVLRVMGVKSGALTFVIDISKAVIAFLLCEYFFGQSGARGQAGLYGCLGVILGHDFTFYLGFKGGKGVASTIGMVFCFAVINVWICLASFVIGILCLFTKYVSFASIMFSLSLPVCFLATGQPLEYVAIVTAISGLNVFQHRKNISRLCNGSESKLSIGKKSA